MIRATNANLQCFLLHLIIGTMIVIWMHRDILINFKIEHNHI